MSESPFHDVKPGRLPAAAYAQRLQAAETPALTSMQAVIEAENIIDRLSDLIENYDTATVADLYDLAGITSNFTDDRWGWYTLEGASVSHLREGYLLNLPKPVPID